jgi:hypothetical protein
MADAVTNIPPAGPTDLWFISLFVFVASARHVEPCPTVTALSTVIAYESAR